MVNLSQKLTDQEMIKLYIKDIESFASVHIWKITANDLVLPFQNKDLKILYNSTIGKLKFWEKIQIRGKVRNF